MSLLQLPSEIVGVPAEPSPPVHAPWLALGFAAACFITMATLALIHPYKLREPDPYAYRASMAALEHGDITLDQAQYDALEQELSQRDDGWQSGVGVMQWTQTDDGVYVSEKNPGYPFLAMPFDAVGLIRLAPLAYGLFGCAGLWVGGRRWLGAWGAAVAIGLFCSGAGLLIMAHEAYMPSFAGAALLAGGGGFFLWSVLAAEIRSRTRVIVGTIAFFALGLATFVRYTDIAVLAVFAIAALIAAMSQRRQLGFRVLLPWGIAAALPLLAAGAYNQLVYGKFLSTGYTTGVSFSWSAISRNIDSMPEPLVRAMPLMLLAVVALFVLVGLRLWRVISRAWTPEAVTGDEPRDPTPSRFVVPLLVGWWLANWGVYAFYDWTGSNLIGEDGMFGGGGSFIVTARFYLPAMGALALLGAWLLSRAPRIIGAATVIGLFIYGGWAVQQAVVEGDFLYGTTNIGVMNPSAIGGGPGGLPGGNPGQAPSSTGPTGALPDFSQCDLPDGFGSPGDGNTQPSFDPSQIPDGFTPGQGMPQIELDENGCPVLPPSPTSQDP